MATVGRATLTALTVSVLLLPATLVLLLQGPSVSPAYGFPLDDFGDGVRITFDAAESVNVSSVVDRDGNMHVVWEDYRSGAGDVYYVKLDSEGNKLTNDAKITNDATVSKHPAVAVDATDHIYVVWEDLRDGVPELYFAKMWYYDGNITFLINGLRVSDADPADSVEPDIEVDMEGNLVMVWADARDDAGDGNLEIYYKRLNPNGAPITADVRITTDVGQSERPKLDVDENNMVHIVWYDFRDSDSGIVVNHGVFYRKVWAVNGTGAAIERRITFASPVSKPDLAVDTDGNVHVVFDDDRYASFDVFYTLLDNNGVTLKDDMNISPKDDYESRAPSVYLSDSNAIDVAWQDQASGHWAIHYSAMAYDGALEVFDQALTGTDFENATAPVVMCARDNNTFVLFIGQLDNNEVFFQRTHRPDLSMIAGDITLSDATPLVDQVIWVNATIRNLEGDAVEDLLIRLYTDGIAENETIVATTASGGKASVSFCHVAAEGETSFTVAADPDQAIREIVEGNNQASVPLLVRIPGVDLSVAAVSLPTEPGDSADFDVTITNEGSHEFLFLLSVDGVPEEWPVAIAGSPEGEFLVPAASSEDTTVQVSVPEGTAPGPRMFNVTVECAERDSVTETIQLMVDVLQIGAISVRAPSGGTVEPTVAVTYNFTVSNDANANESFLVYAEDDLGWELELSIDSLTLAPGEIVNVYLTALPARYDPPTTLNMLTVRLVSLNLSSNTGEGNVLCVVGEHREVGLYMAGMGMQNYSVPDMRRIAYAIDVTNLGNVEDVYRLVQQGLAEFWAVLNTSYVYLEPGDSERIFLYMTPGSAVLAGDYMFNLTATSESDPEISCVLDMGVSILPFYDLEAFAEVEEIHVKPGSTIFLNLTVENCGNTLDGVDGYMYTELFNASTVIVNGEEIDPDVSPIPTVTLEPGEFATITLKIVVPEDASEGLHEIYADFYSAIDPAVGTTQYLLVMVDVEKGWPLWVIIAIAGGAGAAAFLLFMFMRMRAARAQEEEAEQRKKLQQKKPAQAKRPAPKGV